MEPDAPSSPPAAAQPERTRQAVLCGAFLLLGGAVTALALVDQSVLDGAATAVVNLRPRPLPWLLALFWVGGGVGPGVLVLQRLGAFAPLGRARLEWAAVVGAGLQGTALFVLSWMALFLPMTAAVLFTAEWVCTLLVLRQSLASLRPAAWPATAWHTFQHMPPSTKALAPLLVVPLALLALRAGAPPTFYDALVYHLGLPMQMMARGEAFASPHDMFTALPLLAEMAASGALLLPLLGSPEAFAAVFAVWALLLLTCFADLARGVLGTGHVGVAAALALGASPVVGFLPLAQKSDLLAALFVALALRGLVLLTTGAQPAAGAWVIVVALGLAGATKTQALPLGVLFVVGLAIHPESRRALRLVPPTTLLPAVCVGIALAAPPLVRNVVAFGNPLYPFASGILGGRGVDPADLAHTTSLLASIAIRMRAPGDIVDLLLRYAIHGDPAAQEVVGPLAPMALLLLLLLRPLPRPLAVSVLLALLALPVWLWTNALARYAPVLTLTTALSLTLVISRAMEVRPARLFALCGLGLSTVSLALWSLAADDIFLRRPGALPKEEMLRAALEPYGAYRAATALAGNSACVFVVGAEPRRAYAEVPLVPSEVYMVPALVTVARAATNGDGVRAAWRAQGVTHVIVDRAFANVLERRGWALPPGDLVKVQQALSALPPPLFDDGRYTLHGLGERAAGACGR